MEGFLGGNIFGEQCLEGCEWLRLLLSVGFGSLGRQHVEYPPNGGGGVLLPHVNI